MDTSKEERKVSATKDEDKEAFHQKTKKSIGPSAAEHHGEVGQPAAGTQGGEGTHEQVLATEGEGEHSHPKAEIPGEHVTPEHKPPAADHVTRKSDIPEEHVPHISEIPGEHDKRKSKMSGELADHISEIPGEVKRTSKIPEKHIEHISEVSGEHVTHISEIPGEHVTGQSEIPSEQITDLSEMSGEQTTATSELPSEHVTHTSEIPGEHMTHTSEIPGEHVTHPSEIPGEHFYGPPSTGIEGEDFIPQTASTSPFDVTTTDAEDEQQHYNSEETAVSPVEAPPKPLEIEKFGESGEYTESSPGIDEVVHVPPTVELQSIDLEPFPPILSEGEEDEYGISDFVIPVPQKYHPEDGIVSEDEEEGDVFPYKPYIFPPDEQMGVDDIVVKYLYNAEEFSGEVDDYNLDDTHQFPERELSTLSVNDLDEMIRMLQGDKGDDSGGHSGRQNELLGNINPSTIQDTSGELATSAVHLEHSSRHHEEDHLVVLGPNHPKMKRFQEALKQHLEKQMYQATCDTRDAEHELKLLRREREETGQHLYNLQFELARQSEHLNKIESQLEHLHRQRVEQESTGEQFEIILNEAKEKLRKEIDIEEEMIHSIKEMDMMEWCIRQTDADYEGEAIIQGQLDEQYLRIKTKTEVEKRNQDFYLDKVMTHVQRMEQANSGIQRQIQAHLDEQRDLNTSINEAGTEIEVIQIEKHHLSRAWNETISVVRSRDDALRAARETLQSSREELRNHESELRSITRGINKEQERHEEKTILLKRRRMEERIADSHLNALQEHATQLQLQLGVLYTIKQQVEQEYLRSANLLARKEKEILHPRRQLEIFSAEKARLEDLILFHMQEHDAVDKVTIGLAKKIQHAREKTRKIDSEVAKVENDMTNLTITVERLRTDLLKKTTGLEELDKKLRSQEKILQAQAADMKQSEKMIQKKSTEIENMNRKLKKLIDDHGGVEVGPLEAEIEEIEKQISAHRTTCVDLQEHWLKLQDELVQLTSQRDGILAENELIRKEAFIMERKKQRLDTEVSSKKIATEKIKKQIEILQSEILVYNTRLFEGKEEETQMDRDNILIQNEFISLLKDAETEAVELQQEVSNLEEEKDALTIVLTEGHEKRLWWEKKVRLARELRESIKQEQESSTSALKLAIHHMQVRYQELMRVQEKLMGDLDRSIDRRDRIITQADHELRRANVDPNRTKLNIQRNRVSIEEKNRQVVREAVEAEKEVKEMQTKITSLEGKLKCESDALRRIREMIAIADEKINEATVEKHKDLIELVLRQQKYKVLEAISSGRYKPSHSPEEIEILIQEGETLCYELAELCEILINQYPEMALSIKLIKASIFTTNK